MNSDVLLGRRSRRSHSLPATAVLLALAFGTVAPMASAKVITKPRWLTHTRLTEYYPVPESWFVGARVAAPGIRGRHRVDWLYGARGLSMEGDGVGLDGQRYHIDNVGSSGWINAYGKITRAGRRGWSRGRPFWRAGGYWRTSSGRPTFPLERGGWFAGTGRAYRPIRDVTFATGPSRRLTYYSSVAVDPRLIALGSRIYVPAYRKITKSRGWFVAADTGGAIIGRHIDIYRPAPASPFDSGYSLSNEPIYVIPPGG